MTRSRARAPVRVDPAGGGTDAPPFSVEHGGRAVNFALQGTLSNFASGIMILLYRPYDLGDMVSVAGVKGKVESMTLVSTIITDAENQTVVVPNSSIWGGIITNVAKKGGPLSPK